MIRRQINKTDFHDDPNVAWNAFVDLLAMEDYEILGELQKDAYLVFWYDSEVQNGGHFQYLLNSTGQRAFDTVETLAKFHLDCHQAILTEVLSFTSEKPICNIETVDAYIAEALGGRLNTFDSRYYACPKDLMNFLEELLEGNFDEFIELV